MRSSASTSSRTRTAKPVSSRNSRATPSAMVSPVSSKPPGMDHSPRIGSLARRTSSTRSSAITTPPTPTRGDSGYSRLRITIRPGLGFARRYIISSSLELPNPGGTVVVRCLKCAVEIDVDEDEVEEGEILNCPECEAELEVVQIHPVRLNVISDEDEDEEEDEDGEDGEDDKEAAPGEALDDDEEEFA